jgi:hypothetical protein
MQKINRHNYEAYLLDFVEGNLCPEDQHDLFVFLAANPALKSAFEVDFGDVVLIPEPVSYAGKLALHVPENDAVSMQNIDHWMMECVEGNLTAGQQKELADFIRVHRLEKAMLVYESTRLKPDYGITFKNKKALKVQTGIVIPVYMRWAAAAAVILLFAGIALNGSAPVAEAERANQMAITNFSLPVRVNPNDGIIPEVNRDLADNGQAAEAVNRVPHKSRYDLNMPVGPLPDQVVEKIETRDAVIKPIGPSIEADKIANQGPLPDSQHEDVKEDDIAVVNTLKTEQPYKLITDAASDVINRDVYFTRQKDIVSNEYVAYQFKLGNFEFERKKSR